MTEHQLKEIAKYFPDNENMNPRERGRQRFDALVDSTVWKIAVCDDSDADRQELCDMVRRWADAAGRSVQISGFPSAESFLFAYAEDRVADILLLDVEMAGMDGIGLAKRIRREGGRAEIVFVTSHFEFIAEGYEVDALHYLVKPVSELKLCEVLDRAAARLAAEPPSVIVTCDGETMKLYEADILYVESFAHYIEIHTRAGVYRIKESIAAFEAKLSADFYRAHRSYIINLKAVERISRTSVTLTGGIAIPLARGKYDSLNRAFIERN